jgi:hypothetical protein
MKLLQRGILPKLTLFAAGLLLACSPAREVEFKQVAKGFNGPKQFEIYFFENRAEADTSWLKRALPGSRYEQIISQTNFDHQALMAFAIGELPGASGNANIVRISQYQSEDDPLMIEMLIGIKARECKERKGLISYPFVVAVFEKPKNFRRQSSFYFGNFDDGCGPESSGTAIDSVALPLSIK